jgi:transposase
MKSREHYSPEFRAEAVRLVLEQGLGQAEAARRLGIAKGTLSNWVVAAKGGKDTSAIPGARSVAELEAEVARLRKALAQANMERDIIKMAAVDSTCQRNTLFKDFRWRFKVQGFPRSVV